jgi:hypothetical protein
MSSITFYSLVALLAVLLCVGFSSAQLVRSSNENDASAATTPAAVSNSERVTEFTVSPNKDFVSWTAFGREWRVRLTLSEVVEDNEDYFYGTLEGDETAAVSFALLPGMGLSGMLITRTETYWIAAQPVPEHGFSQNDADLVIFMTRETMPEGHQVAALSEPIHPETEEADAQEGNSRARAVINKYKVAVFVDQQWTLASNNPWASQANTIALFNDVNAIYRAAGLSTFTVTFQKQVTNSKATLNDMLTYFSNTLSTSLSSFKDTSFTNQLWLVGQNIGGLAYVGTTCKGSSQNMNRKTAVAGLVNFSRLYTVKTIAHELGHNRGANHQFTNQCSSTLKTGCQCSVMSYCFPTSTNNPDGAKNFFSTFTINEMHTAGCY